MERRTLASPLPVLFRNEGESQGFTGYGSVYYDGTPETEYRIWDNYVERIMPGMFDRALREKHDVRGLFNHDSNIILGRSTSGTMLLSLDAKGLRYDIGYDQNDPDHVRLKAKMDRKDVTGSSFSFDPLEWTIREDGDLTIVEMTDCILYDVGPVTYPAYEGANSGMRALKRSDAEAYRDELVRLKAKPSDVDKFLQERRREILAQKAALTKM